MSDTSDTPTGGIEYDETDDNSEDSVLIDEPTYVGTDVIYKNSAYVVNEPMLTEPEDGDEIVPGTILTQDEVAEAEELAQETEANLATEVDDSNPQITWNEDTVHPSEAPNKADEALKNRLRLNKQIEDEIANEGSVQSGDDEDDESGSPFN